MPPDSNFIDVAIGSRIRGRRRELHLGCDELATVVDLSADQITDIEEGRQRAGVFDLLHIASALEVDLGYFFNGISPEETAPPEAAKASPRHAASFAESQEGLLLIHAFIQIGDATIRKHLISLIQMLSRDDNSGGKA